MKKIVLLVLALGLLSATAAFAQGKSGDNKGKGKTNSSARQDNAQGPSEQPAGWDEGKKVGWKDCDLPPGQAKPDGCAEFERKAKLKKDKDKKKAKTKTKGKQKEAKGNAATTASDDSDESTDDNAGAGARSQRPARTSGGKTNDGAARPPIND